MEEKIEKIQNLITTETKGLSYYDYEELLKELISDLQSRLDALYEDKR
jgi:hypothetical protein